MADWAEHLLWDDDGRFARHPYFKFVVHNMIMRKRAVEQSSFVVRQQLGDEHLTVTDLKAKLQSEGDCVGAKIMYLGLICGAHPNIGHGEQKNFEHWLNLK